MDGNQICTDEEKRKKTTEYGGWVYLQKMQAFHAKYKQEYEDHRDYFSNLALHESYQEEIIAEKLHKQCKNRGECLIDKRRAEMQRKWSSEASRK